MLYRILDSVLVPIRRDSYDYLKLFLTAMVVFTGALAIGGLLSKYLFEPAYFLFIRPVLNSVEKISSIFSSGMVLAVVIFFKNSIAVLFSIAIARRTRGISIALLLVLNGLIIGSLINELYLTGMSPFYLLAGIMPHGVLEFTGVFIGAVLGLKLLLAPQGSLEDCTFRVKTHILKILLPILLLAALMEVYLTPFIFNAIANL